MLPSICLACRVGPVRELWRGGVCAACWNALPSRDANRCVACDEPLGDAAAGPACGRCLLDPPPFARLAAAAPYRGSARGILLAFKFQGADFLGARLADVLVERLGESTADEVAAVPATPRARRERGYHPAGVLAAAVARRLGRPFASGRLVKARETERQSLVPASRRRANVRGAFLARGTPPRRVLLVDDVATSGATARECAARLRSAGAREVEVWCFARASRGDVEPELS
ncbi:MAG TPA: ComF family protein [Thermoanaerobaculia bacterium]|nr:ComF family protein [Thermoanaerobaculia bacterium]